MTNSISPLLAIVGPTASAKSALALHLARLFDGEIVNCDSLQIYRGMDIGTSKPTSAERAVVPHHLYDARNPNEVFTAGEYAQITRPVLTDISARQHLPIVTGGAGFYLRALLDGLFPGPTRSSDLRARLERIQARYPNGLHRILRCWDLPSAARIHSNDGNKLIRALEVIVTERQPLSVAHRRLRGKLQGFRSLKIGLNPNRAQLRTRIAQRTRRMFADGLIAEVEGLRAAGYGTDAKAMESVGYRQAQAVLNRQLKLEDAIVETSTRTSQYAKRQMTWFRRDLDVVWLEGFGEEPAIQAQAESHLKQFLSDANTFCHR